MEPNTIYISRKKLIWTVVILVAVLGFVGWILTSLMAEGLNFASDRIEHMPARGPVPQSGGVADITDTRAFMKTSYNAAIQSRDVQRDIDKVSDAVASVDGRIDAIQSNDRRGSVSFVIAKSDLSEFRDEIETITHAKLYTEDISSVNRLSEKQNIEARAEHAALSLSELQNELTATDNAYTTENNKLIAELQTLRQQLDDVEAAFATLPEGVSDPFLTERETSLRNDIFSKQQQITAYNRQYSNVRGSLESAIKQAGGEVSEVAIDDAAFMDGIETVSGRVSVQRVSLYKYIEAFSPIPMWINLVILFCITLWILRKIGILPRIKLV